MKKMRWIALVLALVMALCIPAIAAQTVEGQKATATIAMAGTSAEFKENGDMITVTVTSNSLKAGSQYVILMVKSADGENYTIDSDSILYIDQTAATASGSDGTVTFDVYPSSMTDGIILIAGAEDGLLKVAIIDGKYIVGDADKDGKFSISDAIAVLRVIAELDDISEIDQAAADVDGVAGVKIGDAIAMLRVIAELDAPF